MTIKPKHPLPTREAAYVWRGGRRRYFRFKSAMNSYAWMRVKEKHPCSCNSDERCEIHDLWEKLQKRYVAWLFRYHTPNKKRLPKIERTFIGPIEQPEIFEPVHESLQMPRLQFGHAERVYLEHWQILNKRGLSSGATYIEHILCPTGRQFPGPISQRDAVVAACVIQWLGTNCGMAFVREAERRIDAEREKERQERRDVFARPMKFHHKHEFKAARPKVESTRAYRDDY